MVAEEGSTFNMWQRGRQKIRECMKHKNGTTLVELIVTFALLGLFMTAATTMLTSSLQMFSRMQATSSAITVSDLILDKIAGEIVAADIPEKDMGRDNGYYFWLEPEKTIQLSETETVQGSQWVVFRNRSKSPIAIFASPAAAQGEDAIHGMGAGQLIIRYYAVSGDKDKTPQKGNQKAVEEIDWHFDNKVYMNYTIENLWFSRDNVQNHPNVIKINLILKNEQTGFKYFSYRYAENYNYDFGSGYMCTKDEIEPGNREFPIEAEEFKIKMLDGGGNDGGGDEPEPNNPEKGDFIVYFVSNRTKKELGQRDYTGVELNKPMEITLPYIAGYKTPNPESPKIIFTDTVRSHTFYYEPILWDYTIHYWTQGKQKLLNETYGKIYTDDSIEVDAPVVPGYKPEHPHYTFTAIGDDVGGNQYYIYYDLKKGDSNHPFVTNGDIIKTEAEDDKPAGWPWLQIAEKVKEFFDSPWHRVEENDMIGYYQVFVYDGKEYAIGGWEGTKGMPETAEEAIMKHNGNPDCKIMIIKSNASNSDILKPLLLYCAKQANATNAELDYIRNSKIKFEFEGGVNLKEVEIESHQGNKKEIELKYKKEGEN